LNYLPVFLLTVAIIIADCYALGVFGNPAVKPVENMRYEGFTYSGNLKSAVFDSEGILTFDDGGRYAGGFAGGCFDGNGVYTYPASGDSGWSWRLVGEFKDGYTLSAVLYADAAAPPLFYRQGEALDVYSSPAWTYTGEVDDNGQNGVGRFVFADGSFYEGEFLSGLANGTGTFVRPDGKEEHGAWAAGVRVK